ncbi:MAG: hypothetical protein Q9163_003629 [Psora crenata]
MSLVGPELPPHLTAKRKRDQSDDDRPQSKRSPSLSPSSSENKKSRIIGPAVPPAPLDERPRTAPRATPVKEDDSSSDDTDDFGPSLPPAPGSQNAVAERQRQRKLEEDLSAKEASKKPQREEWMLLPPSSSDWGSRIDPTKLKNRKFNTGKGLKGPSQNNVEGGIDDTWLETPEQKRQRLEDEMLGRKKPAQFEPSDDNKRERLREVEARATEARIREYNEKSNRGGSLMEEHKKGTGMAGREKEDDPSKRAFDREKDIGLGVKIGSKARRDMLGKARNFGERFAGGGYL